MSHKCYFLKQNVQYTSQEKNKQCCIWELLLDLNLEIHMKFPNIGCKALLEASLCTVTFSGTGLCVHAVLDRGRNFGS